MTTQEIKRLAELRRRILNLSQDEQKEYLTLRNKQHKMLESQGYEMEWDKENLIFYYRQKSVGIFERTHVPVTLFCLMSKVNRRQKFL